MPQTSSIPQDQWLFTYGSLMWSPDFDFLECQPATIYGWHRALCILSLVYRGTSDRPGLVLGLDRGGRCVGRAYRIAADRWDPVRTHLDRRELVNDVYQTRWLRTHLADGRVTTAYGYVARRDHPQYWSGSKSEAAKIISMAIGKNGRSYDYVRNTINDLMSLGIQDHSLNGIIRMVDHSSIVRALSNDGPGEDC
jgi:cation transport protein ChaC